MWSLKNCTCPYFDLIGDGMSIEECDLGRGIAELIQR